MSSESLGTGTIIFGYAGGRTAPAPNTTTTQKPPGFKIFFTPSLNMSDSGITPLNKDQHSQFRVEGWLWRDYGDRQEELQDKGLQFYEHPEPQDPGDPYDDDVRYMDAFVFMVHPGLIAIPGRYFYKVKITYQGRPVGSEDTEVFKVE
jgi:hypothetical protein